jgi:hypothetical protein
MNQKGGEKFDRGAASTTMRTVQKKGKVEQNTNHSAVEKGGSTSANKRGGKDCGKVDRIFPLVHDSLFQQR